VSLVRKLVRFYEPLIRNQKGERQTISGEFWKDVRESIDALAESERNHTYRGVRYYGESRGPVSPATPYIYVGRLRPTADHPDGFRPGTGIMGPLKPAQDGDLISEPTLLLPFGTQNYVAVMSPVTGGTRIQAIEHWLNLALGFFPTDNHLSLAPLWDKKMADKLANSSGATRVMVRVAPGQQVPQELPGRLMNAVRVSAETTPGDLSVEMTWSFGHASGSQPSKTELLRAAREIWSGEWAATAEVNLEVQKGEKIKTEVHHLINDRLTYTAKFDVAEGQSPTEESVLKGMQDAIAQFRGEH
jgi:hypothetical protein